MLRLTSLAASAALLPPPVIHHLHHITTSPRPACSHGPIDSSATTYLDTDIRTISNTHNPAKPRAKSDLSTMYSAACLQFSLHLTTPCTNNHTTQSNTKNTV
ncbi:MAG: hypothetical protein ACKPKO_49240, partial [Candidatus Fonsibacter sp.]